MTIYLDIIRFNFLRFLAYPIEIWAAVIKRFLDTGFLIVFWSIIAKSSHGSISLVPLISYFLLSGAINHIIAGQTLRFGKYLGNTIKMGTINTYLIRPLSIIPYLYSSSFGERSLSIGLSIIMFIIGILINPPSSVFSVVLFLVFLVLAATISFAFNLIVGIFSFYSPEALNFAHVFESIIKVLSGAIAPLTLFPANIKAFALLSPFPGMVYTPIAALQSTELNAEVAQSLMVNSIWAIALVIFALTWWNRAIRNYDAIGI